MRRLFIILLIVSLATVAQAQNTMRIAYKDGTVQDIDITRVDSITFTDMPHQEQEATIAGEWMWGGTVEGYYEVITFNEGCTYTAMDCFFDYGYTNHTYGTYTYSGIMLNLFSNGIGYKRMHRWFVTFLSDQVLEVMTQMGSFTYHRVEPEAILLKVGGEGLACGEGESWTFADSATVSIQNGSLVGLMPGTTYVQRYNSVTGTTKAYKVIVEKD